MKTLSHDIQITLLIKSLLLFILWWVCFKDVQKPTRSAQEWLIGSHTKIDINKQPTGLTKNAKLTPEVGVFRKS